MLKLRATTLSSAMLGIAFIAVQCALLRLLLPDHNRWTPETLVLALGISPMAFVLGLGAAYGTHRSKWRFFLIGFEAFGLLAMAVFVIAVKSRQATILRECLLFYIQPIYPLFPAVKGRTAFRVFWVATLLSVWLTVPQLCIALVGGMLTKWPGPKKGRKKNPKKDRHCAK